MTLQKDGQDRWGIQRYFAPIILPIVLCVATGILSFAFGAARAESEQQAQIQDIKADINSRKSSKEKSKCVEK